MQYGDVARGDRCREQNLHEYDRRSPQVPILVNVAEGQDTGLPLVIALCRIGLSEDVEHLITLENWPFLRLITTPEGVFFEAALLVNSKLNLSTGMWPEIWNSWRR